MIPPRSQPPNQSTPLLYWKIDEIRQWNDEELETELGRLRRHLFDVRAQAVTEKLEDTTMIGKARRDIARIITIMRAREMQTQAETALDKSVSS